MTRRLLFTTVASFALAACAQEDAPDFCDNHVLFHAEHAASAASLSVTMSENGRVESSVRFPTASFDTVATQDILQNASNVYSLQTDTACGAADITVSSNDDTILASYVSECGADNRLGQVDVSLFDSIAELEEVEVTVVTPATQKQFLINRQCATAIFRFE